MEERQHICAFCGKLLQTTGGLLLHMNKHTGQFPFKCSICGKGYNSNMLLKAHMDSHMNVKVSIFSRKLSHLLENNFAIGHTSPWITLNPAYNEQIHWQILARCKMVFVVTGLTEYWCWQESIVVGCVPSTCADRTCFDSHQMSATGGGHPEVNKFEQVSSDGHQMSQAGVPIQ